MPRQTALVSMAMGPAREEEEEATYTAFYHSLCVPALPVERRGEGRRKEEEKGNLWPLLTFMPGGREGGRGGGDMAQCGSHV